MQPGTKVYVRWYGRTLEGEVAGSDGFMGMTPVRIPLDGHHPVALFMPQHVYDSPELLTGISEDQSKVNESLTEVDDNRSKVDSGVVRLIDVWRQERNHYFTDPVKLFKESHWDEAHNHLRTECLDEFYQLWRNTHDCRPVKADNKAILSRTPPIPVRMQPVPQNRTPSNTKQLHKKKPAKAVELSLFD